MSKLTAEELASLKPSQKPRLLAQLDLLYNDGATQKELDDHERYFFENIDAQDAKADSIDSKAATDSLAYDRSVNKIGPGDLKPDAGIIDRAKYAVKSTAADFLPKTYKSIREGDDLSGVAGSAALDVVQAPFRAAVNLPEAGLSALKSEAKNLYNFFRSEKNELPLSEPFASVMSRGMRETQPKNPLKRFVTDPAVDAAVLASIPTGGTSLLSLGTGALAATTANQLDKFNKDKNLKLKDIDKSDIVKEVATDMTVGALLPYVGRGLITGAKNTAGVTITPVVVNSRVNKLVNEVQPSQREIASGFSEDVLKREKFPESKTQSLKKADNIIRQNMGNIADVINPPRRLSSMRIQPPTNPQVDVADIIADAEKRLLSPGFEREQKAALKNLFDKVGQISQGGKLGYRDIPNFQKVINSMKVNAKSPEVKEILTTVGRQFDDDFVSLASRGTGKRELVQKSYDKVAEMLPIQSTLKSRVNPKVVETEPGFLQRSMEASKNIAENAGGALDKFVSVIPKQGLVGNVLRGGSEIVNILPANLRNKIANIKDGDKAKQAYLKYLKENPPRVNSAGKVITAEDDLLEIARNPNLGRYFNNDEKRAFSNLQKGRKIDKRDQKVKKFVTMLGIIGGETDIAKAYADTAEAIGSRNLKAAGVKSKKAIKTLFDIKDINNY